MPEVISTVGPGKDFESILDFLESPRILTAGEIATAECDAFTDLLTAVPTVSDSWGAAADRFVRIRPSAVADHKGVIGDGYIMTNTLDLNLLNVVSPFTEVIGLSSINPTAFASTYCLTLAVGSAGSRVYRCILLCTDPDATTGPKGVQALDNNVTYESCLIGDSAGRGLRAPNWSSNRVYRNNTFVKTGLTGTTNEWGIAREGTGGGDDTFYNVVSYGNLAGQDWGISSPMYAGSNNGSGDGTNVGLGNMINPIPTVVEGDFIDYANDDYRPNPAGNLAGTGLAGQTPELDLAGNPFDAVNPAVGCYEVASTGTSDIKVDWEDNAFDETSYSVERNLNSAGFVTVAPALPADTITYTDTGLAAGSYVYRVSCLGPGGESDYSNETTPVVIT